MTNYKSINKDFILTEALLGIIHTHKNLMIHFYK